MLVEKRRRAEREIDSHFDDNGFAGTVKVLVWAVQDFRRLLCSLGFGAFYGFRGGSYVVGKMETGLEAG